MGTHPIFESDFDCLTDCSKMSAWRAAGLSYVRYSFVASNALKKAMTTEAQALRSAGGGGQNVISRQWENGKPVGDFNWGSKPKELIMLVPFIYLLGFIIPINSQI